MQDLIEEASVINGIIQGRTAFPKSFSGPRTGSIESVGGEECRKRSLDVSVSSAKTQGSKRAASPFYMKNLTLSAYRRPEVAIRLTDSLSRNISDDYRWSGGKVLGRGASSVVRSAIHKEDGMEVAVKCIPKHELLMQRCDDEFRILQQISHPNIVRLRDVYESSTNLYLVMDLAKGDLYSKIEETGRFTECMTKKIVYKILEALRYLHDEMHIVHRDVKPENILCFDSFDCTNIKLTDFGLAKRLVVQDDDTHLTGEQVSNLRHRAYSRVGSDYYTAPEINEGYGYDTAVDLYSLGVCTYILLMGSPPGCTSTTLNEKSCDLSSEAQDFISKLLSMDPKNRPTAAQVLQHDWFHHTDWRTSLTNRNQNLCAVVPTVPLQVKI
jgi:serine/threonine protein kinase